MYSRYLLYDSALIMERSFCMIGGLYGYSAGYGSFVYNNVPVDRIAKLSRDDVSSGNDAQIRSLKRSGRIECQTCKERKYQDGSDEMVSFKSAAHISPSMSAGAVRAHEQEHVANAYDKAAKMDGKVISANVNLKTATCPECGRSYVAGGTTTTQIKYNESNPYEKNQKLLDSEALAGQFFDYAV